jgi:hypothetical protein
VTRPAPRLVVAVLLVAAVTWLGFRAVRAFDVDRHKAEAAAVLSAPDKVSYQLPPAQVPAAAGQASPPPGQDSPSPANGGAPEREGSPQPGNAGGVVHSPPVPGTDGTAGTTGTPSGRLSYRPGTWLSVVELEGLDPVAGDERYLVFLRNWAGWTLAGAARPGSDGTAQVRSAAEPRPPTIYEVVVTRGVDDATSVPHGQPVLQWFDVSLAPPKARRFDFARGS